MHGGEEVKKIVSRILVEKPEGKRLLGRPSIGGCIIVKWISERQDGMV
jgi:hypothetical protein